MTFALTNPENADLCDFSKSQWYTPPELAERIVDWALSIWANDRLSVLEPSCGRGALVRALRMRGAHVMGFDIDPANIVHCWDRWQDDACFYTANFLDQDATLYINAPLDLAVMNPPFEDGAAEAHIAHALTFAPRVVAHVPLTTLAGKDRREGLWSSAYLKRLVIHSTRPKYSGSRTGGMTDMCTIDVVRRSERVDCVRASGVEVAWWP